MRSPAQFHSNNKEPIWSNPTMKKFCIFPVIAALAFFVSCEKPQSEDEKKAEVERQVQERLASERQADEAKRLAQQQADLEAREKALAEKEAAAAVATPAVTETPVTQTVQETTRETSERRETVDTSKKRSSNSYGTFYRKLEPHGAWRETSDYGYVWQPREAEESRTWRPYTDGRWVYSDAGWTWMSEEPYGWATYHYGRWVRLRRIGWVWVPGDEWAPAWVSWRTSKDYVGWAPLPPEARFDRRSGIRNWADNYYDIGPDQYAFVPCNEFTSERVRRVVVPTERNVTIVIETTNVTNITYANTTIVNEGPNYEEMRSRSRSPIERYRLRRHAEMDEATLQARVRGDEIDISAPVITRVPGIDRPQTVKETIAQIAIDTGWTAIADRSAADRARKKIKSEATPPPDAPPKTFDKPETTPSAPATTVTPAAATATPAVSATKPAVSATPVASATPAATATPAVSATKPAVSATPVASATAATTATPATPAISATKPAVSATPTATASPIATATPVATATLTPAASAAATVSASPTPRLRPVHPLPTASVSSPTDASPLATAAPRTTPTATVPSLTPRPTASVSPSSTRPLPSITVKPRPSATVVPIATPTLRTSPITAPPSVTPEEQNTPNPSSAAEKAEVQRKLDEIRKAKTLKSPAGPERAITPFPTQAPRQTVPAPASTPSPRPTSLRSTEPTLKELPPSTPASKSIVTPRPAITTPPPAKETATTANTPVPTVPQRTIPRPPTHAPAKGPDELAASPSPPSAPSANEPNAKHKRPNAQPTPSPTTAPE